MVLASTDESLALDKLAELADKVMEVATPSASLAWPDPIPHLPSPGRLQILHFAGTTRNSAKLLTNVGNLAPEG